MRLHTKRLLTLDELAQFMEEHWDRDQYNDFRVGHPTSASASVRYVILPATDSWCVIVYPKGPGLFSKKNKVKLACTYTTAGAMKSLDRGAPRFVAYNSVTAGIQRSKNAKELNQEMRTASDGFLTEYAAYLRELLSNAGLA